MNPSPITLTGRLVELQPLGPQHVKDLAEAGADPEIWKMMSYGMNNDIAGMTRFVRDAQDGQARGTDLAFAVIHRPSGKAIGSTRYLDIRREHRGLEVGGTWYAPEHRRTGVNTECKLVLFHHAFDTLSAIRVQLKTDLRNERSQRAIERLGAVREGLLRNHMILADGYQRTTVMYSITHDEWPEVRSRLEGWMSPEWKHD